MSALIKAISTPVDSVADGYITGWASVPVVDRSKHVITGDSFDTSEHELNPVVLWAHDKNRMPIGQCITPHGTYGLQKSQFSNGLIGLRHTTRFNLDDEYAAQLYELYKSGKMRGWSVGCLPRNPGRRVPVELQKALGKESANAIFWDNLRLVEYSAVPIPDNQYTLSDPRFKALNIPNFYLASIIAATPESAPHVVVPALPQFDSIADVECLAKSVRDCVTVQFPNQSQQSPNSAKDRQMSQLTIEDELTKAMGDKTIPQAVRNVMMFCDQIRSAVMQYESQMGSDSPEVVQMAAKHLAEIMAPAVQMIDDVSTQFPEHASKLEETKTWFTDNMPEIEGMDEGDMSETEVEGDEVSLDDLELENMDETDGEDEVSEDAEEGDEEYEDEDSEDMQKAFDEELLGLATRIDQGIETYVQARIEPMNKQLQDVANNLEEVLFLNKQIQMDGFLPAQLETFKSETADEIVALQKQLNDKSDEINGLHKRVADLGEALMNAVETIATIKFSRSR